MSRTDREDAMAKALDLLPTGDPANSDPRILRQPELVEEARATREAAADVWLATSPLRAAPPDVLHAVMGRIGVQAPVADRRKSFSPLLAASGWAAAAAAFFLWPGKVETGARTGVVAEIDRAPATPRKVLQEPPPPATAPRDETRYLKSELQKLRNRLERLDDENFLTAPRVMALTSPGAAVRTPEETQQRVWSVLTQALRSELEAESTAPNDPAALVIERGWLPEGLVALEDGSIIRHRNFPEESWQDLGLMRADDGSYYDPVRQLVWAADPDSRGFIGRKSTPEDDLAAYQPADDGMAMAQIAARTAPEGFLIEDPVTNVAEVVIDQVPPPEEGREQVLVWTDALGGQCSIKVSGSAASADGPAPMIIPASAATSADGALANTIVFSIPGSGGVQSFQLIETSIKPNGKPHKVIVSGGKSGPRLKVRSSRTALR